MVKVPQASHRKLSEKDDDHGGALGVVYLGKKPTKGAMLVVGFPTPGLVGSIAAGYLVESLRMEEIGFIAGDNLPPTVTMADGVASSPFRLYSSGVVCGPDRKCSQLLVALADIQPEILIMNRLSRTILDWAESRDVALVMIIEGTPVDGTKEAHTPHVVATANPAGGRVLKSCGFSGASGQMTGMGGALVRASLDRTLPVLCLITEVSKGLPDSWAAASVVELLGPLVPPLHLDPTPLRITAKALEKNQRRKIAELQNSLQKLAAKEPEGMYR